MNRGYLYQLRRNGDVIAETYRKGVFEFFQYIYEESFNYTDGDCAVMPLYEIWWMKPTPVCIYSSDIDVDSAD